MEYVVYWFLFFGILFAVFSALFYLVVFMQYKHIKIAVAIFDASADFAVNHIRLVIVVYIYFMVLIATFWGWWYMLVLTMSLNDITTVEHNGTYFKQFQYSVGNFMLLTFMVMAYFWLMLTINTLIKFFIICTVSSYYFNSDD